MKKAEAYQSIKFYCLSSGISNTRGETDPTAFSCRRHQDPANLALRCDLPSGCGRKFYALPSAAGRLVTPVRQRINHKGRAARPRVKNGRIPYHEREKNENEKGKKQGGKSDSIDNGIGDAWNSDLSAWDGDRELQYAVYRVRLGVCAVNGSGTSHGTMH
ncbi:hypothetical protein CDEST_03812 [Colletotrichum destructivum]|uniref:Uncharacterized protein n=1 Tax=Colletotrichum destructivum TaxID=34406 RepID=A0AAX4I600_9PEZI|nr:hypothetical protein CDEST_03812 [Colletotrichum destructivum]